MASWLTHLRIAEKIKASVKDIDLSYLMIGSIAPDSGAPDKTFRIYDPSKDITHYRIKTPDNKWCIDCQKFYDKYMIPQKIIMKSDKTRAFLWGYYFHLITDKLWLDEYFLPNKADYHEESEDFIDLLRQEMRSIDIVYLKENDYNLMRQFGNLNINVEFFNLFNPQHIYDCKKRILDFYTDDSITLDIEQCKYLSYEKVNKFIDKCVAVCINSMYGKFIL